MSAWFFCCSWIFDFLHTILLYKNSILLERSKLQHLQIQSGNLHGLIKLVYYEALAAFDIFNERIRRYSVHEEKI